VVGLVSILLLMRAPPDGLDTRTVVDALREGWDVDADDAEYAAVGGGSYHWQVAGGFVTVDHLGQKAWLGDTYDAAFDGLRAAFETAVALRRAGLDFVVAPIPSRDGASLRRIDARYSIALFPLVEGETGEFGYFEDDEEGRCAVVEMLARLHGSPVATSTRTTGFDLPGRRHLEAALRDLEEPWSGGPLSEPAREAVRGSASVLAELIELADRLRAEAQQRAGDPVVTHGEPHAGNVMRTDAGHVLVDWDTVALGPPERDMWMLVTGGDDAAELYTRATGTQLDHAALDFFRLTWDLKDLAEYLNVLRSPHLENDDTLQHYGALKRCGAIRDEWASRIA
jgi:spectinomycin phosphotransferase